MGTGVAGIKMKGDKGRQGTRARGKLPGGFRFYSKA